LVWQINKQANTRRRPAGPAKMCRVSQQSPHAMRFFVDWSGSVQCIL
jgi:hypothetical protein